MTWRFPTKVAGLVFLLLVLSGCYGVVEFFDGPGPEGEPGPLFPHPMNTLTPTPTPTHTPTPTPTPLPPEEPEESPTRSPDSENES